MSNSYYNNTRTYLPGTKADGADVDDDLDAVATGFDLAEAVLKRSFKAPTSETSDQVLGASAYSNRASRALGFDASGNLTTIALTSLTGGPVIASGDARKIIVVNAAETGYDIVSDFALSYSDTVGGTANAITLAISKTITAYATGQDFVFKASSTNTGAVTVAIDSLAATAVQVNGNALVGGEIVANRWYKILYDGTAFQLSEHSHLVGVTLGATYYTTSLGIGALSSNTTGASNVAVGYNSLTANTIGVNNTAVGYRSLYSNTTGIENTAVGYLALYSNTTGIRNTALGDEALYSNTEGIYNCSIGFKSLYSNTTGRDNVAVGFEAGYSNTIGDGNVALGYQSIRSNTTGASNVAIGRSSLYANTIGKQNTASGQASLSSNTTGDDNTAIGNRALVANTTGAQNTAVGSLAGDSITTGSNLTCIGYDADSSSATATNEITLGNASVSTLRCAVTTITAISDQRDKTNIQDMPLGLEFINSVRPVRFDWNMRNGGKKGIPEGGFIAQELLAASKAANAEWLGLVLEANPDRLEASPGKLLPVMVKAIQELSLKINQLESEIGALKNAS